MTKEWIFAKKNYYICCNKARELAYAQINTSRVKKMSKQPPKNKPTGAYVVTLITGIINIILAVVLIILAAVVTNAYRSYYYFASYYVGAYMLVWIGIWVLIASIILIAAAVKLNSDPWGHSKWGQ